MKDIITRAHFVELRAAGKSLDSIAVEMAVSKKTAAAWAKELAPQIAQRCKEILAEVQHELGLSTTDRVKKLTEQFLLVEALLADVDLSELKARDLLNYYLKFEKRLSEISKEADRIQPTPMEEENSGEADRVEPMRTEEEISKEPHDVQSVPADTILQREEMATEVSDTVILGDLLASGSSSN